MPPSETSDVRTKRGVIAERIWLVAVGFVLFVLAASLAVSALAVSPSYCATCHGDQVAGLGQTAHAGVDCDRCHMSAGAFGVIDSRLSVIAMVPAAAVGGSVSDPVANATCEECHTTLDVGVIVANGLRMSHREVREVGWSCTRCHAAVGHGLDEQAPRGFYTMGDCLECHSSNPAEPGGCSVCHAEDSDTGRRPERVKTPWRVTHGPNWRSTHGMGDLNTCKACHLDSYCVRCHNMQVPHPPDFKGRHGALVVQDETRREDCGVCHRGSVCDDCHGIEMPHPVNYLPDHADLVERDGDEACSRCHAEESCQACHSRHIHPGIAPRHLQELQSRPVR
jgi:hypothetical protein